MDYCLGIGSLSGSVRLNPRMMCVKRGSAVCVFLAVAIQRGSLFPVPLGGVDLGLI